MKERHCMGWWKAEYSNLKWVSDYLMNVDVICVKAGALESICDWLKVASS